MTGGVASCWGSNRSGQLGNGTYHHASAPTPVTVSGPLVGAPVAQVAVGEGVACALTTVGAVACWGGDGYSKTGNAATTDHAALPVPVATNGPLQGRTVTQISAKRWHVCALTADSAIVCWGFNASGQLGNGNRTDQAVPVAVVVAGGPLAGKTIASIDVGYSHSCALATDGTIGCWGSNSDGQLGNGTTTDSAVPVAVKTMDTALEGKTPVEVSVGQLHTCARTSDGSVACWGSGIGGALGRGNTASSKVAVPVKTTTALAGKTVADVEAGGYFTCVRTTDGLPICWGTGTYGQQGNGLTTGEGDPTIVTVAGTALEDRSVNDLAVGLTHSCAVSVEVVACWGQNKYGQIGNGVSGVALVPAPAVNGALTGATVDQIAGGPTNGCARTSAGVACWGENGAHQVEFLDLVDRRSAVLINTGGSPLSGSPAVDLAVGAQHACAVSADGQVTCWGSNGSKQLGRSGYFGYPLAVANDSGTGLYEKHAVRVVAGTASSCALTSDGVVVCWGGNAAGQLGNGTTKSTFVPTAITTAGTPLAGKTVVDLAYGDDQGCALASDSTLACWGINTLGALGNGSTVNSLVPVAVTR
ncbi:MAG TPA: hypothetical protein VNQ33_02000, partial [Acidimicrobiales bacterium]|nr:hypothetical protein [Acidimicrobiales bacterium]